MRISETVKREREMADWEKILTNFESPSLWPVLWRRAYILTLPLSFPLHVMLIGVLLILGAAILGAAILICAKPTQLLLELWAKRPDEIDSPK